MPCFHKMRARVEKVDVLGWNLSHINEENIHHIFDERDQICDNIQRNGDDN